MSQNTQKEREKLDLDNSNMNKRKSSKKWTAIIMAAITGGAIQGISILLEMFIPKYWHIISIVFAIIGGFVMYYVLRKAEKVKNS